jgi:hypothetical protein
VNIVDSSESFTDYVDISLSNPSDRHVMKRFQTEWRRILIRTLAMTLLPVMLVPAPSTALARDDVHVALKSPQSILIIRHGEKPVDEDSSDGLTPKGEERARELHRLFEKSASRPEPFPKPDFVFAAKATKNSRRSKLTVAPLAERLMLPVNDSFGKDDAERLVKELLTNSKYTGKTVLICWQHGGIPDLAKALGGVDVPREWPSHEFNRVWRLTYSQDGKAKFRVVNQRLLEGDAAN